MAEDCLPERGLKDTYHNFTNYLSPTTSEKGYPLSYNTLRGTDARQRGWRALPYSCLL